MNPFSKTTGWKASLLEESLLPITKEQDLSIASLAEQPLFLRWGLEPSVVSSELKLIFDFQSQQSEAWISSLSLSPQTIGGSWEKGERQGKELCFVDCRPCAGGLPQPLFLGLVLRGGWERDFSVALQNEKWHGFPKRGASSACYGLVKAVILICTPFLHCLIMERRCQGLIGRITWSPVKSR